jgi:hypothetical protein
VAQFVVKLMHDTGSDLSAGSFKGYMTVSTPTADSSVANVGRRSREKIYKLFPPNS